MTTTKDRPAPPPSSYHGPTVLLIGTAASVCAVRCQLAMDSQGGFSATPWACGCVLVDPTNHADAGLPVLGGMDELPTLLADLAGWHGFETAIVSLPIAMQRERERVSAALKAIGIGERFMPTMDDIFAQRVGVLPAEDISPTQGLSKVSEELDIAELIGRPPVPIDRESVGKLLRGKRVLVTGAGGSIGSELARIVSGFNPERLILMERAENPLFEVNREIREAHPTLDVHAVMHDVVDEAGTHRLMLEHEPHIVFHAAAHKHVPLMEDHPAHAVTNNLFGTRAVALAAVEAGVERFVMISTDKAVNPSSVMGATKRLAERFIQGLQDEAPDTLFSMVRFGNVLGSAGSVLPIWSRQLMKGNPLTVTDERMTRYFMTIPEAATLVIESATLPAPRGVAPVYVLDMGEPVRILDLARRFLLAHGLDAIVGLDPAEGEHEIVFSGARPGEKLHEELVYEAEQLVPTRRPGIDAWAGQLGGEINIDAMIEELATVRSSPDRKAVLRAIKRHVPEMNAAKRITPASDQSPAPVEPIIGEQAA